METDMKNKNKHHLIKKRLSRSRSGDVIMILALSIFTLIMMIPLIYAIGMSLKPANELWVFPPTILPQHPTLKNFKDLFSLMTDSWVPIQRYLFNSVLITAVGTFGHIILASMAAYVLSRYTFPGSRFIFSMIKGTLMFSGAVLAIPNYLVMNALNLTDSYMVYILPAFSNTLGLFLMKQFMDQMIPMSLLESAEIDGANDWVKFTQIVMPLVKPAWLTLIVFSVRDLWATGASPYVYTEQLKTLPYALSQIATGGVARAGVGAAISIILILVPLVVFILSQSNVMETMSTSGMKE
ncbi:MAG: carbohydrate ABC transporter permease [Lachnospiraceae bacterium]|nr:carbohydrate ABC transporter permease [Lachnospiraceae bacterium]